MSNVGVRLGMTKNLEKIVQRVAEVGVELIARVEALGRGEPHVIHV